MRVGTCTTTPDTCGEWQMQSHNPQPIHERSHTHTHLRSAPFPIKFLHACGTDTHAHTLQHIDPNKACITVPCLINFGHLVDHAAR